MTIFKARLYLQDLHVEIASKWQGGHHPIGPEASWDQPKIAPLRFRADKSQGKNPETCNDPNDSFDTADILFHLYQFPCVLVIDFGLKCHVLAFHEEFPKVGARLYLSVLDPLRSLKTIWFNT